MFDPKKDWSEMTHRERADHLRAEQKKLMEDVEKKKKLAEEKPNADTRAKNNPV